LRRFVLRRFIFTTLVESERALPTCGASLSQLKLLSLLSALLALFRCARVSSFPILVQFFFKLIVIFPPMTSIKKTEKKKKSKQLTLHSFLMSSEPRPGPSSTKEKVICLIFSIICVIFYKPNSLN